LARVDGNQLARGGRAFSPVKNVDLVNESVALEHNGHVVGTNMAAEVMGNPLNALAWLANQLGARGRALMPGDIVMSGGISKLLRGNVGDTIHAKFSRLGSVSMTVAS
jgi:2-keto-4-pentenoate hydratase